MGGWLSCHRMAHYVLIRCFLQSSLAEAPSWCNFFSIRNRQHSLRRASGEGDILSPQGILCACAVSEWYNHQAIFAVFENYFDKNFGNSKILFTFAVSFCACGVMVAALDLGSNVSGRGGSSPFMRTRIKEKFPVGFFSFFCLYIKSDESDSSDYILSYQIF